MEAVPIRQEGYALQEDHLSFDNRAEKVQEGTGFNEDT